MRAVSGFRWAILAIVIALLLAGLPGTSQAQGTTYTVQPGDTLRSIAEAYGTTVEALLASNKDLANPDMLSVGQSLVLPPAGATGAAAGDTTPTSANNTGAATQESAAVAAVQGTPADPTTYTVKPGDTLNGIADLLGTSVAALMDANDIPNPDVLSVGATLQIPEPDQPADNGLGPVVTNTPAKPSIGGPYNRYGGGKPRGIYPTRFTASISQEHCWLVQNNLVTGSWPCSSGRDGFQTPTGFYTVESKMPVAYGSAWGFNMPYWLGLYTVSGIENGIHGLPYNKSGTDWGNQIGTPVSFGCIVLEDAAAKQVYDAASLGMQVIIVK
jgi:LysM repeat protein